MSPATAIPDTSEVVVGWLFFCLLIWGVEMKKDVCLSKIACQKVVESNNEKDSGAGHSGSCF